MTDKPFEVVAEITLQGLPTSSDIARIGEDVERARRDVPAVVRATLSPPARFRDGSYCLEARFAAWAADGPAAQAAVQAVLRGAGVTARTVYLSGRALAAADVPPPAAEADAPAGRSAARRQGVRKARAARSRSTAPRARAAKTAGGPAKGGRGTRGGRRAR